MTLGHAKRGLDGGGVEPAIAQQQHAVRPGAQESETSREDDHRPGAVIAPLDVAGSASKVLPKTYGGTDVGRATAEDAGGERGLAGAGATHNGHALTRLDAK